MISKHIFMYPFRWDADEFNLDQKILNQKPHSHAMRFLYFCIEIKRDLKFI